MHTTATRPLLHAVATLTAFATLCAPASATTGTDSCPGATKIPASGSDLSHAAGAIFCLVNAERTSRGVRSLKRDPDLAQAARGHALALHR